MAYSANGTKLYYKKLGVGEYATLTGGATTAFPTFDTETDEIPYLMEVPELGKTVEKIDITTLSDSVKRYLPGTKDYGDLVFKFLYDNSDSTANYAILRELDEDGEIAAFRLEYPDKDHTAHEFYAIPSVKMDAGALNGALTFSATMLLQSDIEIDTATA